MLLQTLISVQALNDALEQENTVILDCRFYLMDHKKGRYEYEKGHVPKAIFVDVHHELAGKETELTGRHPLPEQEDFADQLQRWGIDQHSRVIVYDDMGGAIAARAWWMLSQQGIETYVLNGGINAWQQQGFPISMDNVIPERSFYRYQVSFPWQITEQQIVENFELDSFVLVDARAKDRYQGENETIDPVAGHIPGAVNRPFSDNLIETGEFKTKEDLLREWNDVASSGEPLVHYCGSGITSCHNVLAMNYAGLSASKVYVGSWSQWAKRMLKAANITS
ncbi:sulfurtransferase [Marinomonas arenicola]|uniref:sulfurtransferase n=1 Tax=Marinomonas arenicola TaxID=569601 RepID=UPI00311E7041